MNWAILWIEAVGKSDDDLDMVSLENKINDVNNCTLFSWEELFMLSNRLTQVINLVLIGDSNLANIKRYQSDSEMFSNCKFTIELVDSSYWLIHFKSRDFLESLNKSLKGITTINIE